VTRRTFLRISGAAIAFAGIARSAAGFLRQPYLQRLLANSASVLWTSAANTSASLTVVASGGSTSVFNATVTEFDPSVTGGASTYYQYRADVTGLKAGSTYQYQVAMDGQVLAADPVLNSFTTPTTGNFSFLVVGDTGNDSADQMAILQRLLGEPDVSKVIHVGDIAYDSGSFPQFEQNYFQIYAPMMSRTPFFTAPGNHEYMTNFAAPYLAVHAAPASSVPAADLGRYYSFDQGDAHFTALDSNLLGTAAGSRMLAWLDADLAATQKFWKIVFLHHPPYPTGAHLGDPLCVLVQQLVNPIVEKHFVPLVLAGHEHGYERSYPLVNNQVAAAGTVSTTYVISGGGGAGTVAVGTLPQTALALSVHNYLRVDVTAKQLMVTATGEDGSVIDQFTLTPPPVLNSGSIVNAGDFSSNIAPGSLVSAFGANFAIRGIPFGTTLPLPTQLGGVSVKVNGTSAPLVYVSPAQVNFQMPYGVAGQVTVQMATVNGSTTSTAYVTPTAPSILAVVPASPGGWMVIYGTGLGAPTRNVPAGQAAAGPVPVSAPVQVMLDTMILQPAYAGLAPGFPGLNQINLQLPVNLTPGSYNLQIVSAGAVSASRTISVGAAQAG
jgi:uncharacterized protein (TIGR03437 family)